MSIIVNDNIQVNSGKALDNKYLKNGVTPYVDVADVNATIPLSYRSLYLTVMIGTEQYWYYGGVDDINLVPKPSGGALLPVVRYVYLVNDASDATRMGGASSNVYTTFQTAYDAANTLQIALGGLNRVVIMVGNTVAGTVGSVALTANWNSFVEIVGIGKERSLLGNITITGVFTCTTKIINAKVGNITAEGGIGLTLNNSDTGNLVTSSATGNAGAIGILNSNASSVAQITMSSSLGNVGALTFSSCQDIIITGNVSMTQTSTTTSFSVGDITMTSCNGIIFSGTVTVTMAYQLSTGTIGGLNINSSNQNISFTGNVRITGYANNTNLSSDVVITQIYCVNCTFSGLYVNNITSGFSNWEGGTVTTVNFHKCFFRTRVRISYNNTTDIITGATFRMTDCQMIGSDNGVGLDFHVYTGNISFDSFVMQGIESNFNGASGYEGIAVANSLIAVPPTVPFTIDGVSAVLSNINGYSLALDLYNPTTANTTYDAIISGCNLVNVSLNLTEGDINFKIVDSSTSNNYYLLAVVTIPTKRTELIGCNFNSDAINIGMNGGIPINLKNSYIGFYTDVVSSPTLDVIAYNSFVESFAQTLSTTTWTGTFNTSTLRRLTTDSVVGVTFNNSYDETY